MDFSVEFVGWVIESWLIEKPSERLAIVFVGSTSSKIKFLTLGILKGRVLGLKFIWADHDAGTLLHHQAVLRPFFFGLFSFLAVV